MTPSARLSAAIDVLDRVLAGAPAEQALTNWARASRYAGSGDRSAVRDLVFDALRCRRSFAALGGAATGRGLVLGGLRDRGGDAAALFTGETHAPAPLSAAEAAHLAVMTDLEALDCPDWIAPALRRSLGADFAAVMRALRTRAPVFLRVNTGRTGLAAAQASLREDAIETEACPLAPTALRVVSNARKIQASEAYRDGLVEVQDAASQAVAAAMPLSDGDRVLDFCAGGGGKTLALAARRSVHSYAHDHDPRRMSDLPARAQRAAVRVQCLDAGGVVRAAPYDLVVADVPCSGSGSWRRAPDAKWALTESRLDALRAVQARILDQVAPFVAEQGHLAYVTCSLIDLENDAQISQFLSRQDGWREVTRRSFTPLDGADGFFLSVLTRR